MQVWVFKLISCTEQEGQHQHVYLDREELYFICFQKKGISIALVNPLYEEWLLNRAASRKIFLARDCPEWTSDSLTCLSSCCTVAVAILRLAHSGIATRRQAGQGRLNGKLPAQHCKGEGNSQ